MLTKEEIERYMPLLQNEEYSNFFEFLYSVGRKTLESQDLSCLDRFEKTATNKTGFFLVLLMLDEDIAPAALNCGKVSGKRIGRLCRKMEEVFDNHRALEVYRNKDVIEDLKDAIFSRINALHIRFVHSFETYYFECGNTVLDLYFSILLTESDNAKYPALGGSNSQEMFERMDDLRKLVEKSAVTPGAIDEEILNNKWSSLGFDEGAVLRLKSAFGKLGYFPLFKAIQLSLESLAKRDSDIVNYCLNIFTDVHMLEMADVAQMDGITRERVRQLRVKSLDNIQKTIRSFKSHDILAGYKYDISSEYELGNIASREEVTFNENFILWTLSHLYSEYRLIGDIERAFFKYPASNETLFLIPKSLCKYFNFKKFIKSIDNKLIEKRYFEERIELEMYAQSFCSDDVETNVFYDILSECRKMLERGYPDIISNSQLFFTQNSRKAIPDLIEDILRANNGPMTAEEISSKLNKLYPDLDQTPKKIGPNALRNPNISAISRTSTYTLAEWDTSEKRGGTIRDLAQEYLNSLIEPIAPLTDICDYIAKFRTDVKDSSVKANLLAEASNRFSIYYKDEILHIGYTDCRFDPSFTIMEKRQGRRSFQDSISRLETFIKTNERFPFSSGVDAEESRLNRFLGVSRANLKKGRLSTEEVAEIERIETQYAELKTKKERVSWDDRLERFVSYITLNDKLPIPSSPENKWYEESKELYLEGALDPDKAQSFTMVAKIVDRMMK